MAYKMGLLTSRLYEQIFHEPLLNKGYLLAVAANHLLLTTLDTDAKFCLCFCIEYSISTSSVQRKAGALLHTGRSETLE